MKISGFMRRYVPLRRPGKARPSSSYRWARRDMAVSFYREAKAQGAHKQ